MMERPIRDLQTMLRTIARYDSHVRPVVPDGIYAEDTVRAVTSFQERHGLPVTGVTDAETWEAIADAYREAVVEVGPAEPVSGVWQSGQVIRARETNGHLYMIHGMLLAIREKIPSLPRVFANNVHDDASVAAIRWLQERAGLAPTGDVTRLTWKYLSRLYRVTVWDGKDGCFARGV